MPRRRRTYDERTEDFHLNPNADLWADVRFAGLGRLPGSEEYCDSSPFVRHGTLTNMTPATDYVRAIGRPALDFDGSNDYVSVPSAALSHEIKAHWTIAFFATGLAANNHAIGNGTDYQGFRFDAGVGIIVRFHPAGYDWTFTALKTFTALHHLAFTGDSAGTWGTVRFYLDGQLAETKTDFNFGLSANQIGKRADAAIPLRGLIADVCKWGRVLQQTEIAALADPGNPMYRVGGMDGLTYQGSRSVSYASSAAPLVSANYWVWARQQRAQVIGGGLA